MKQVIHDNHIPPLACHATSSPVTYHLSPTTRDFGWALCTVNDRTCELCITSDWGNWAHRWPDAFGKHADGSKVTLTQFIAGREHCNYIADKLWPGGGYGGRMFDAEDSVRKLRAMICEKRLDSGRHFNETGAWRRRYGVPVLYPETARELWSALDSLRDCNNETLFVDRVFAIQDYELITDEPWDHLGYVQAPEYTVLLKSILPALRHACAERLKAVTP